MHLSAAVWIVLSMSATVLSICWTSPLGIMLGKPPRAGLFGPPARPGDCNLPLGNGGAGAGREYLLLSC